MYRQCPNNTGLIKQIEEMNRKRDYGISFKHEMDNDPVIRDLVLLLLSSSLLLLILLSLFATAFSFPFTFQYIFFM